MLLLIITRKIFVTPLYFQSGIINLIRTGQISIPPLSFISTTNDNLDRNSIDNLAQWPSQCDHAIRSSFCFIALITIDRRMTKPQDTIHVTTFFILVKGLHNSIGEDIISSKSLTRSRSVLLSSDLGSFRNDYFFIQIYFIDLYQSNFV